MQSANAINTTTIVMRNADESSVVGGARGDGDVGGGGGDGEASSGGGGGLSRVPPSGGGGGLPKAPPSGGGGGGTGGDGGFSSRIVLTLEATESTATDSPEES